MHCKLFIYLNAIPAFVLVTTKGGNVSQTSHRPAFLLSVVASAFVISVFPTCHSVPRAQEVTRKQRGFISVRLKNSSIVLEPALLWECRTELENTHSKTKKKHIPHSFLPTIIT